MRTPPFSSHLATPGLVVAAIRSGSGKTTVTLGLLRALTKRGITVVGLKNGPDYIDPAFHSAATGRTGVNLDSWAMPSALLSSLASSAGAKADLLIHEGSMGLFDGVPAQARRSGSTASISARFGWPVVLVVDVSGQSQSAAAIVAGCAALHPRIEIAGVILNRVGSPRHRRLCRQAIEEAGFKVFGALPRHDDLVLPERHLGLVQAGETTDLDRRIDRIAALVEQEIDLDALVESAHCVTDNASSPDSAASTPFPPPGQRIALAADQAFSFVYAHILDGWRQRGAEIVPFSPLLDEAPSQSCDACWLPGGYPELHAEHLAAAQRFMSGLATFSESKPVHGECGGYMVLGQTLTDARGNVHRMAGLLGLETTFATRKLHLGYREATLLHDTALGRAGTRLRGHEFHYASILTIGGDEPLATAIDAYESSPAPVGSRNGTVTGSFFHTIAKVA